MANYLAIDASTEACSAALLWQGNTFQNFDVCPQSHSTLLLPMVDKLLKEAGCKLNQLDGLVFGRGPGSFTGVRIGIGVAQGLAYSANLPLVGVSTLQALAQQAYRKQQQTNVIACIDARMSEIYQGQYQLNSQNIMQLVGEERVIPPQTLTEYVAEPSFGVGTGWNAYNDELLSLRTNQAEVTFELPDAVDMLTIAMPLFEAGQTVNAENAQPTYVRDTVSWKKLPGRE